VVQAGRALERTYTFASNVASELAWSGHVSGLQYPFGVPQAQALKARVHDYILMLSSLCRYKIGLTQPDSSIAFFMQEHQKEPLSIPPPKLLVILLAS